MFTYVIRGRPGGLLQFSDVRIFSAPAALLSTMCPNRETPCLDGRGKEGLTTRPHNARTENVPVLYNTGSLSVVVLNSD